MEVCAASVQGAVVPGSDYAFAALTRACCHFSLQPDLRLFGYAARKKLASVSRHTSNSSTTRFCSHYTALGGELEAAAAVCTCILSGQSNPGREKDAATAAHHCCM